MQESDSTTAWETDEEKQATTIPARVGFFLNLLTEMKYESKPWRNEVKGAWREYQAQNFQDEYRKLVALEANSFPRYWSDTMTMLPAIFSRIPEVVAQPECSQDPVSNDAAIDLEKLGAYLIKRCNYRENMTITCLEFLHASSATARIYFEASFRKVKKKIFVEESLTMDAEGQQYPIFVDDDFNEVLEEILYDDNGLPYYESETEEEEISDPRISFSPLFFDQRFVSPGARSDTDIWLEAYEVTVTRKEAYERFGRIVDKIKEGAKDKAYENETNEGGKEIADLFQFYEVWDKRDRKVYCIHEFYREDFLKVINLPEGMDNDDPYELDGFFPRPRPMVTNQTYCDLFPVPDFTQTRDMYETLNLLIRRINRVSASIKGVMLYDGSVPEIQSLFNELFDGQGIACSGFDELTQKGSVDNLVWTPPYERLAQTLRDLIATFIQIKDWIDEIRGISDIIRGYSDPNTTLGAEKQKVASSRNRLSLRIYEVERFNRDLIEMMCDLALKTFDDAQLKDVMEFNYKTPEQKERFPQVLVLLRDSKARKVHIELETDSLIAGDEEEAKQRGIELLSTMGQYFANIFQLVQTMPFMAPLAMKIAEMGLASFRQGKHAQDELKKSFEGLFATLNKPETQEPPPPPDPRLLKIQSDEKIASQQMQIDMQKSQVDAQVKMRIEEIRAAADAQKEQTTAMYEQFKLQLDATELELKKRIQLFTEQIEAAKLNEGSREFDLKIREQLMQEARLEQQNVEIPAERMALMQGLQQQTAPPAPNVVINVTQPEAAQPILPVMPPIF